MNRKMHNFFPNKCGIMYLKILNSSLKQSKKENKSILRKNMARIQFQENFTAQTLKA